MRWSCALVLAIAVASTPAHADEAAATNARADEAAATNAHADEAAANARADEAAATLSPNAHADEAAATLSPNAHADEAAATLSATAPPPEPAVSARRRAAAVALAIVPGVVVHGIGAWTVREKPAAKKILTGQLIGMGIAGIAGVLVGGSGGNKYTIVPGVPLLVAGSGLLLQSWFTDIWVAAGGRHAIAPPRAPAPWSVEAGSSLVFGPFHDRYFMRAGGRFDTKWLGVAGSVLIDPTGAEHGEGDVYVRLLGPAPTGDVVDDNSRVHVRVGSRIDHDDSDRNWQVTGELEVSGRLDLHRVDDAFGRSFIELGAGLGVLRVSYDDMASEIDSMLLGHFRWGAYLGRRGEASVFYEHTRDNLVGGFPAWRAAGFVGSLGAGIDVRVKGPWAVRGELVAGNAIMATTALAYRGGPR